MIVKVAALFHDALVFFAERWIIKMKNRIRLIAILFAFLLNLLTLSVVVYGSDFDGLEGVVVLTPDGGEENNENSSNRAKEGLSLSLKDNSIEKVSDTYVNIILQVELMNWDSADYRIEDTISAKLYYQDEYAFIGNIDFDGENEIGMLVNLKGTISFQVPNIVAVSPQEDLMLEFSVLEDIYVQDFTLTKDGTDEIDMPFSYDLRQNDGLELKLNDIQIYSKWNGEKDEKYKWIVQKFSIINWSLEKESLENELDVLLTYDDKYGFEAQIEIPQGELNSLEEIQGNLIFHVPVIVAENPDLLSLRIKLEDEEWDESVNNNIPYLEEKVRTEVVDEESRGYIGIRYQTVSDETASVYDMPKGCLVSEVVKDGPADKAGIQKDDIITEFDDKSLLAQEDLNNLIQYYEAGENIIITVSRKKNGEYEKEKIELTLGLRADYNN